MGLNRTTSLRLIKIGLACIIGVIILIYAISRSLQYSRGPSITIFQPSDYATIGASITNIEGRADRVNVLKLNSQAISMDEQGHFKETITVFPGSNTITLRAEDQFGRNVETLLHITGSVDFPVKISTSTQKNTDATSTPTM